MLVLNSVSGRVTQERRQNDETIGCPPRREDLGALMGAYRGLHA